MAHKKNGTQSQPQDEEILKKKITKQCGTHIDRVMNKIERISERVVQVTFELSTAMRALLTKQEQRDNIPAETTPKSCERA